MDSPFTPNSQNELIFTICYAISEIQSHLKNCHKSAMFGHGAWLLNKSSRSCIFTILLPQWIKIQFTFAIRAASLFRDAAVVSSSSNMAFNKSKIISHLCKLETTNDPNLMFAVQHRSPALICKIPH